MTSFARSVLINNRPEIGMAAFRNVRIPFAR
jgi:hypothetical protein